MHHAATSTAHRTSALTGFALLALTLVLTAAFATEVGDALTRNTIRLALAWYFAALLLLLRRGDPALTRWCWTWAWASLLVHVALSFHYFHHWSHADAFERTRLVSGAGEGIFVNYALVVLWTVDVFAWWRWPAWHAALPKWVTYAWHGFLLFVVFNSMVVFADGLIRWTGVVMFICLGIAWLATKSRRISQSS
jgi:hypothetical protein